MLTFVQNNLATIVVSLILLAVIALVIRGIQKDRKTGKSACGCSCGSCPSASICHGGTKR